jgi:hypothetical protein
VTDSNRLSRQELYDRVWSTPLSKLGPELGLSGRGLAKRCAREGIPVPRRGYWEKLRFGKSPERPALPEVLLGTSIERPDRNHIAQKPTSTGSSPPRRIRRAEDRPSQHALLVNVQQWFDAARVSEAGYLRPRKRLMLDLLVSQNTLSRALETANTLYLDLEDRGHRVLMPPARHGWHRPTVELGSQPRPNDYWYRDEDAWGPDRPTVVMIGTVAFGLTIYEPRESADVRRVEQSWVRISETPPPRRGEYDWTGKHEMPTGKLCLRAFSPYEGTNWKKEWRESRAGQLPSLFKAISKELEGSTAIIVAMVEEAARAAEEHLRRMEQYEIERRREELERRRLQAIKESKDQLFAAIEHWGAAKKIEGFFTDAEERAARLNDDERAPILDRVKRARQLVGVPDALQQLREWRSPDER